MRRYKSLGGIEGIQGWNWIGRSGKIFQGFKRRNYAN